MKHRRNKVKREHGIIQDALAWLEELTRHPEVSDVIPGVIEVSRSPGKGIVYKYETQTGCKLLLKSNGSIQEAFVVTKDPAWVKGWVEKRFPSPVAGEEKADRKEKETRDGKDFRRTKGVYQHKGPSRKAESQTRGEAGERRTTFKQRSAKFHTRKVETVSRWTPESWASAGDLEAVNVSEQLNPAMARALRTLQKQLKGGKTDKGKRPAGGKKR